MTVQALKVGTNLTDNKQDFLLKKSEIFFSPIPQHTKAVQSAGGLPEAWLDLHVSGEYYEVCGKDRRHAFLRGQDLEGKERVYVSIPAGASYRFKTAEVIGTHADFTAIFTNVAGIAVRGLAVAAGRIDPGFGPDELALVVTNLSRRAIDLHSGDKIATVCFFRTSEPCRPREAGGWGGKHTTGYSSRIRDRLYITLKSSKFYFAILKWFAVAVGAGIITALINHLILRIT